MLLLSAPPCEKQPRKIKTSTIWDISYANAHNSKLNLPYKLSEKFPETFGAASPAQACPTRLSRCRRGSNAASESNTKSCS